jgi:hypothetical protein
MKNTLFNITRVLAVVVMIGALSLIGAGNPKVLPFSVLFFVAVFAIVYLLNSYAKKNEREGKAGAGAKPIVQLIVVILFVAIVSVLGYLRHGILGYLVMFAFIAVVFGLIYLAIKNRQRHFELTSSNPMTKKVLTTVTGILAIALPVIMVLASKLFKPDAISVIVTIIATLVFIALNVLALILINRKGSLSASVIGYILVILAAILPGIMVLMVTNDSGAFAKTYLAALVAAVLAYFSLTQFEKVD